MQGVSTLWSKLQKEKLITSLNNYTRSNITDYILMVSSFTIGPVGKWPVRPSTLLTWCTGPHYRWTIVGVELVDGQWWWNASLRPERTEHFPVCLSSLSFLTWHTNEKKGIGERGWRLNKEKPRYQMNSDNENRKRKVNKEKPKTRENRVRTNGEDLALLC